MSEVVIWTQPSGPLCLWQCWIHQPIVFLYERGLLIYIIYFIRLILFIYFFIILNLPAGVLLVPWLWFFCTLLDSPFIVAIPMFNIKDHLKSGLEYQREDNHSQFWVKHKIVIIEAIIPPIQPYLMHDKKCPNRELQCNAYMVMWVNCEPYLGKLP